MSMDATKYKPYPAYKESGVEWLGDVPEHWEVAPVKRSFDVRLGKMLQTEASSPADELCHYLRAANIQWFGIDASDIKQMWFSPKERRELALVNGDLLVSEGGDVGRSTIWYGEIDNCYFQNSVNRVRSRDQNSTRFLCYWISAIKDRGYIDVLCNKSTIAHFTAEKVQAVPTPLPPTAEQQTIAFFLDRETAKIDTLIAKQERLIELLGEKRTALISHAVTKGLNPDAPMKDSGVEWLGEVPEHWEIACLKRLIAGFLMYGANESSDDDTPNNPRFVRITDIDSDGNLREDTFRSVPFSIAEPYLLKEGDVLLARSGATVGKSFIYKSSWGVCCFAGYLIRARLNMDLMNPDYLYACCQSSFYWQYINSEQIQSTIQNVSAERYGNFVLPLPPIEEQKTIAAFLDCETAKIDTLITKARRAIDLLKERRTALISAAVTGKIDVREAFPSVTPE